MCCVSDRVVDFLPPFVFLRFSCGVVMASASQEARETSLQHCQGCNQQRDQRIMQDVEGPQSGNPGSCRMCCLCLLTWQIRCMCAELPDDHGALEEIITLLEFTHRLCTQASPAERARLDEQSARPRPAAAPPCRAHGSPQSSTSGTTELPCAPQSSRITQLDERN